MKSCASFVIIASFLVLAVPAGAKVRYRLDLFASANVPLDKNFEITQPQAITTILGKYNFSRGVRGGVRIGADGLGHFGQDISYSYGTNSSKIVVPSNGEFALTSRVHQFAYNVLFYPGGLRSKKVLPFVTVGAGGEYYTISQGTKNQALQEGLGNLKNHVSFAFNAGGGFRIQCNDHVGFRVDARDWMSHPPRYGIPAASNDPKVFVFPVKGIFQQLEFSVAFVYRF